MKASIIRGCFWDILGGDFRTQFAMLAAILESQIGLWLSN